MSWGPIHFPHSHITAVGPTVKCANWPSWSNCEGISCALSTKTPTFITIHEMQPFPGKCGEMQMFKGRWRPWRSAGRPLCTALVGHDFYLLWQRPVSAHRDAHKSIHTCAHWAVSSPTNNPHPPPASLSLSLIHSYNMTKSGAELGNWVRSRRHKGMRDTSASQGESVTITFKTENVDM